MFLNHDQVIIHLDLDMFFCSVELLLNPKLPKDKLLVVYNDDPHHGIVVACNYKSRAIGIQTGMPLFEAEILARRTGSSLLYTKANYKQYYAYTHKLVTLIKQLGKGVEVMSVDELFLDISSKWKSYGTIINYCQHIIKMIKINLGLDCKIGVSFTKYLAKTATNYAKKNIDNGSKIFIINHNNHFQFLRQLKTADIHYVGKKTLNPLIAFGINTAYDLISFQHRNIVEKLMGVRYQKLAHDLLGMSQTTIDRNHGEEFKSISFSKTVKHSVFGTEEIYKMMLLLFKHLWQRLQIVQNVIKLVKIYVKYVRTVNNFTSYQKILPQYTNSPKVLLRTIKDLVNKCECKPIIAFGLTFGKLIDIKQDVTFLPMMPSLVNDQKIYKIINFINKDLNICFITTVFEYYNRKKLFQERFSFRRTLAKLDN